VCRLTVLGERRFVLGRRRSTVGIFGADGTDIE
jgi:hypothetical protein